MRTLHSPSMQLGFRCGDIVEVASTEEGFVGSYYEAMVIAPLARNHAYIVQYKTLITDDISSAPLREVAPAAEVRPRPPKIMAGSSFRLNDVVDAFDNDGWWVGRITGGNGKDGYFVYFDTTGDEIAYPESRIRFHRDWVNGKWVL